MKTWGFCIADYRISSLWVKYKSFRFIFFRNLATSLLYSRLKIILFSLALLYLLRWHFAIPIRSECQIEYGSYWCGLTVSSDGKVKSMTQWNQYLFQTLKYQSSQSTNIELALETILNLISMRCAWFVTQTECVLFSLQCSSYIWWISFICRNNDENIKLALYGIANGVCLGYGRALVVVCWLQELLMMPCYEMWGFLSYLLVLCIAFALAFVWNFPNITDITLNIMPSSTMVTMQGWFYKTDQAMEVRWERFHWALSCL